MRKYLSLSFAALLFGLTTASAPAQEACKGCAAAASHGPPALMLLNQKAVRDDLKLSEEQTRSLREATVKQMTALLDTADLPPEQRMQKRQEMHKQTEAIVSQVLRPEQSARLKQIALQVEGPRTFACPKIAKDLGITEEQQQRMKAIHAEARKEIARLFGEGQPRPEAVKAAKELRQRVQEQIVNVLTDAQKARWKELTGDSDPGRGFVRRLRGRPAWSLPELTEITSRDRTLTVAARNSGKMFQRGRPAPALRLELCSVEN